MELKILLGIKQIEAVKEYQDAPQEVKDAFERHIDVLYQEQAQQNQRVISGRDY